MGGEITLTREQAQKVRDALGTAVERYDLMGAFEDGHDDDDALPGEAQDVEAAMNLMDARMAFVLDTFCHAQ